MPPFRAKASVACSPMSLPPLRRAKIPAAGRRRHRSSTFQSPATRRRRKRLLIVVSSILGIAVLLATGGIVYARWRFDQIPKVHVAGLTPRDGNDPFTVLLVGSDSRSFVSDASEASQYGSAAATSGQRSDVIILARVVPALGEVQLMSVPRDTYVDIPGNVPNISGDNRINASFNSGATLLVQTIEQSFHIPINDYAEVNFPGFEGMVNAVGGIGLDFAYPVRDAYSDLNIANTGCQLVSGAQALALVRSRHLYYYENDAWQEDYGSDWSRIQRQDAFFRALLPKMRTIASNPGALNGFLGAATKNIAIDETVSESELLDLGNDFTGISSGKFHSETLPTVPYTTSAGADVLLPAAGPDEAMIKQFLAFGTTAGASGSAIGSPSSISLTAAVVGASGTTVTTIAGGASPGDVVYNTSPEPWNPTPCTPK
jgi:LCP family protein required for cell wall assembly